MAYIGAEPIVSATRTITEVTATAGQTVFVANGGYTVGYIDVFLNGAQLQTVDFTATNGSSITLTEAAQAGDVIRLVAWGTFGVGSLDGSNLVDGSVTQGKLSTYIAPKGTPAFSAYQSTDQTGLSSNTYTKCNFQTEEYDTNSNFNSSRFTPTVAGYYQVNWGADILITGGGTSFVAALYKNGALYKSGSGLWNGSGTEVQVCGSALVYCNGSTDYLEVYVRATGGSARQTYSEIPYTFFNGAMVRAA